MDLLLRTATSLEIEPKLMQATIHAIKKNVDKVQPSIVLQLSRYLETKGLQEQSMEFIAMAYKHHKDDLSV